MILWVRVFPLSQVVNKKRYNVLNLVLVLKW